MLTVGDRLLSQDQYTEQSLEARAKLWEHPRGGQLCTKEKATGDRKKGGDMRWHCAKGQARPAYKGHCASLISWPGVSFLTQRSSLGRRMRMSDRLQASWGGNGGEEQCEKRTSHGEFGRKERSKSANE